ncbi:MAG: PKD domain-containing protein [Owenweeksia sp.]
MKKITFLISISLLFTVFTKAQNLHLILDVWEDNVIGLPVTNHPVLIHVNPANGPSYSFWKNTNSSGIVDTLFPNPGVSGYFIASTVGCDGNYHYAHDTITTTGAITYRDTLILNCPAASCGAGFTSSVDMFNPAQINFSNTSTTPNGSSNFLYTTYSINYGDGITGSNPNGSHVYSNSGTFQVCMTVTTRDSLYGNTLICQDTYCDSVTITSGPPVPSCSAQFSVTITDSVNRIIQLGDQSSIVNLPSGGSVSITWEIDNDSVNTTGAGASFSHTFAQPGIHYIEQYLKMYDVSQNLICNSYSRDSVLFPGTPASCNGNFSYSQSTSVPNQVTVNIPSSAVQNIPAGGNAAYTIDMGDGTVVTGVTSYTHTYSSSGGYNVCVNVKALDSLGTAWCSNTRCKTVYANALSSCFASFYPDTLNSGNGTVYVYNNSSTNIPGGTITSYQWSFGDGTFSSQAFPTHTYSSSGSYNLCLTIGASNGSTSCTDTICNVITVDSLGNVHFKNGGPGFTLVVKDPSVGLDEQAAHNLEVYPNPANHFLSVEGNISGKVRWQLIDMRGTAVGAGSERLNGEEVFTIDVSAYSEGLYILRLEDEGRIEHFKIKFDR